MKRSKRLMTLVRLAGMAEHAARLRLARANQDLQQKQQQQELLESYEREYAERWIDAGRDGLGGAELQRIGAFRTSLGATLRVQEHEVSHAREGVSRAAGTWAWQRGRERIFAQLQQRARKVEDVAQEKREQLVVDDLVAGRRASAD